jgi:hypothetical protein
LEKLACKPRIKKTAQLLSIKQPSQQNIGNIFKMPPYIGRLLNQNIVQRNLNMLLAGHLCSLTIKLPKRVAASMSPIIFCMSCSLSCNYPDVKKELMAHLLFLVRLFLR